MYYGKGAFTFSDSYTLPTYLRRFYLKRLEKEYTTEKEYIEKETNRIRQRQKSTSSKIPIRKK